MSNIFGKSNSRSDDHTYNANKDLVNGLYTPVSQNGVNASDAIAGMLGLNGPQGQNQAFDNWRQSTGYQFGLNEGIKAINGNAATEGILNSGDTLKALNTYGQNYANTQYGNYVNQLQGLLGSGLQAGGLLANVGQQRDATSQGAGQNGGVGGLVSSVLGHLLGK